MRASRQAQSSSAARISRPPCSLLSRPGLFCIESLMDGTLWTYSKEILSAQDMSLCFTIVEFTFMQYAGTNGKVA
ncbi:hypothetical protein NDU88_004490 [Pleurodeles waltl]|uniref:Uncharacterized protein n=1 Tax=Pleurodeles waltl TaxID=8319 RepID=A0AAV7NMD1_PLEWA|nr:hypothetical protein NDU88_004490 [Pleurodeles waltl]